MIRNYYTEAFKGGITPSIVPGQLIDGTVKIIESTTATSVQNIQPSVTLVLTLNAAIKRGMYITAPAINPAIDINTNLFVEQVVHGANTTVTLNKTVTMQVGQVLTFFSIAQSSWKEYSLYIGTSPVQQNDFGSVTSATANLAAAGQREVTIKVSNPYIGLTTNNFITGSGPNVYDDGVLVGKVTAVYADSTTFDLVSNLAAPIADGSILTFAFDALPSITVLTVDNKTVTFTNPAQGFVLPVSVVQVISFTGGLANLIALE
tara:strand:- start:257 stop:1042 length:786 start_codon:yes stop_codon:yes gene_type:complete